MIIFHIKDPNTSVDVLDTFGDPTFHSKVNYKHLALLQWQGMYWLIPIELLMECELLLKHRLKNKEAYNMMSRVVISVSQCIPIPSKTAKILLEL